MATGTLKKTPKKARIGSDNKRKTKTGNSTPKNKKTPRFYDVKIRITAEEYSWGMPYFDGMKYLPKFVLEAYREKVKRAEAHDKEAKQRALLSYANLLEETLKVLFQQGKLDYLNGK